MTSQKEKSVKKKRKENLGRQHETNVKSTSLAILLVTLMGHTNKQTNNI